MIFTGTISPLIDLGQKEMENVVAQIAAAFIWLGMY